MTKAKELRDQSLEELEAMYNDCCAELFELKNKSREDKIEKPDRLYKKRKDIARILTIVKEKKLTNVTVK